jgi:hypothetical protein
MGIFRRLLSATGGEVRPFIFTLTITSANTVYELPLTSPAGEQPNIAVDWGDGSGSTTITNVTGITRFHTYTSTGSYQVTISGYLPGFNVNNNSSYRSLYTAVNDWGQVGLQQIDFYGCINLTSLPNDGSENATLNEGLNTVLRFNSTFRQTGITYIPAGIFDFASNATSFNDTFVFCQGLTGDAIPDDLFDNNTQVTSFSGTFNACLNLTTIPPGLFDNNTQVVNFSSVFRNCRNVTSIPSNFFTNNQAVTTFRDAFNMATTANQLGGTTPQDSNGDEIWQRTPTPVGTDCFAFCTSLTNFASIPTSFK